MANVVITFDPFRRRRPTARCIDAVALRRIDLSNTLSELEREQSETRERLRHVPDWSPVRPLILRDLLDIQAGIEQLRRALEYGTVIAIGGRRG